jgi:hypothetical protein
MAQERGGLLIRGSDGSLWLMRPGAKAPEKLKEEVAEHINHALGREPQPQISGLSPAVQTILKDEAGVGEPDGIIIWW